MRRPVKAVLEAFVWMEAFSVGMDRGAECFCFEGFGAAFGFRQRATWYSLLASPCFRKRGQPERVASLAIWEIALVARSGSAAE